MSILKNLLGNFMPHSESRSATGTVGALNAEVVLDVNGDECATIRIDGGGATLNATYVIEGSVDGTNYGALLAYPIPQLCASGTIPLAPQPMLLEAINTTSAVRVVSVCVAQLKKVRVRLAAYTAGSATVVINADERQSISPYVRDQKSTTLSVTATGAVSAAVTATLPAVVGLRHYIDFIEVTRSATAALTTSATPVLVTTTNIPSAPALTFGSDAAGIGVDKINKLDFGTSGIACTAIGTNTTIVCPVYTGVIWRVNVAYRLGL